jgi:hypothetical protein
MLVLLAPALFALQTETTQGTHPFVATLPSALSFTGQGAADKSAPRPIHAVLSQPLTFTGKGDSAPMAAIKPLRAALPQALTFTGRH